MSSNNEPQVPRYHYIGLSLREDKASKLYSALMEDYIDSKQKTAELENRILVRDKLLEMVGIHDVDNHEEYSRNYNKIRDFNERMQRDKEKNNPSVY